MSVSVPPIKSQGIKTKPVPWIKEFLPTNFNGRWIEPFMGTGVVGFNMPLYNFTLCDINPHIINFYNVIKNGEITSTIAKDYLLKEGKSLLSKGGEHYYKIRERFNNQEQPLDFLFLNRACFNGMIRFNKKGGFNVPFCKKPERFAQAYITKICNQILNIEEILKIKKFNFKIQSFEKTIQKAKEEDIIYCDPPYIGRHADYYNSWDIKVENCLYSALKNCKSKFILSAWHHNDYRENEFIKSLWGEFSIKTREHFYHVGGSEKNRNSMVEAIITNFDYSIHAPKKKYKQFELLRV